VTVSDDGITTELVRSLARTSWDYWTDVEALSDGYEIAADKRGWIIIIRRAFISRGDEDAFRQITARHLPAAFARDRRTPT
jgi:hypothetical protein